MALSMEFKLFNKEQYQGNLVEENTGEKIGFYTKKQIKAMKKLYPQKEFNVAGELCTDKIKDGEEIGQAEFANEKILNIYKSHNRFKGKVVGYSQVGENTYLAVVKNVFVSRLLFLLLAASIVIGSTVMVVLNPNNWVDDTIQTVERVLDIDPDAKDKNDSSQVETKEGIAIPGYGALDFKANQLDQKVSLKNPEQNKSYFVMSLILPDGTVIYKSKMVPPGKGIYDITLDQPLAAGSYENSILFYECFSMDDNLTPQNCAQIKLTLNVK